MLVVDGYFDGNVCLVDDKISQKPQKVKITFLEDFTQKKDKKSTKQTLTDTQANYDFAIDEAFGLWKNHDNSISVDDYVRNIRKGRQFDIR